MKPVSDKDDDDGTLSQVIVAPHLRDDRLMERFFEAAKASGMVERNCIATSCGRWFLTRTEDELCPPCRARVSQEVPQ